MLKGQNDKFINFQEETVKYDFSLKIDLKFNTNKYINSYNNTPIKVKTIDKSTTIINRDIIKNTLFRENYDFLRLISIANDM